MVKRVLVAFAVFCCNTLLWANTLTVPGQYTTINSALSAASAGDTVLVSPGVYFEYILWPSGKPGLHLMSVGDSSNTIIDGGGTSRVMRFSSSSIDSTNVIDGFSLRNGYRFTGNILFPQMGAGIYIWNGAHPFFRNCQIYNNTGGGIVFYGAGIAIEGLNSGAHFENCCISRNRNMAFVDGYGGAIYMEQESDLWMRNCIVADNAVDSCKNARGGGLYAGGSVNPSSIYGYNVQFIRNSIFGAAQCEGAGVFLYGGFHSRFEKLIVAGNVMGDGGSSYYGAGFYKGSLNMFIRNGLIVDNVMGAGGATHRGAGLYDFTLPVNDTLINVTIANNMRSDSGTVLGSGLYGGPHMINCISWNPHNNGGLEHSGSNFIYSNIRTGAAGIGNIDTLPQFLSATDYHIHPLSPCEGAGTWGKAPNDDLDGIPRPMGSPNPDMGCYEASFPVWMQESLRKKEAPSVFPNPSLGSITVDGIGVGILEIRDMSGRVIKRTNSDSSQCVVNTESLSPGTYLVVFRSDNGERTAKFSVSK